MRGDDAVQFRGLGLALGGGYFAGFLETGQPLGERLFGGGGLVDELRLFERQHIALGGEGGDLLALRGDDRRHLRSGGLAVGDGLVALAAERLDLVLLLVAQRLRGTEGFIALAEGGAVALAEPGDVAFVSGADFIELRGGLLMRGHEVLPFRGAGLGLLAVSGGEFGKLRCGAVALGEELVALRGERGGLALLLVAQFRKLRDGAVAFAGECEAFLFVGLGQGVRVSEHLLTLLRELGALLGEEGDLVFLRVDEAVEFGGLGMFFGGKTLALLLLGLEAGLGGFFQTCDVLRELGLFLREGIPLGDERCDLLALGGDNGRHFRTRGLAIGDGLVALAKGGFDLLLLFLAAGVAGVQRLVAFAKCGGVLLLERGEPLLVGRAGLIELRERLVACFDHFIKLAAESLRLRLQFVAQFRGVRDGFITLAAEGLRLRLQLVAQFRRSRDGLVPLAAECLRLRLQLVAEFRRSRDGLIPLPAAGLRLRLQLVAQFRRSRGGFIALFAKTGALLAELGDLGLLRLDGPARFRERGVFRGDCLGVLSGEIPGLLLLLLRQRIALLGECRGLALLRFERLAQSGDLVVAFLGGVALFLGESGEFGLLLPGGVCEAADGFVAFLQRGLALGGECFDFLAVRLLDFRDLRGGGLLLFQLAELGKCLVTRLHRGGLFRAHGGEFLFVALAERREFRLRLFPVLGQRGLLLRELRRRPLPFLFPLLPAGLQFVALLERRRALLLEHLDAFRRFRAKLI